MDNLGFDLVQLTGLTREEFAAVWGKNMQNWGYLSPSEFPDQDCFIVKSLQLVTKGTMGMHVMVLDEAGAPIQGMAVAQGWKDGQSLPDDSIPCGGDPRGFPNRGNVDFTNSLGVVEWTWGPGEGFAPETEEGAHWYWIPLGPAKIVSDVVYGFGWRKGTEHYHLEIVFQRLPKEPEPPDYGEDELATAIIALATETHEVALANQEIADAIREFTQAYVAKP
jgi:hypothetical protein